MKSSSIPKTVDAYISAAPPGVRGKLRDLRTAIRSAAPEAEEKISYRMPYYHYKGRLAYFAAFEKHVSIFIPTPVVAMHKRDLKNYHAVNATVRFPLEKKIPLALVKKLVKTRVKLNQEKRRRA